MATTWKFEIDWNRDGLYTGTNEDITQHVISARWFLGMRRPYATIADDSMLTLELNNASGLFSPERDDIPLSEPEPSPIASSLRPLRKVQIRSIADEGEELISRTHWVGWIESIQPAVDKLGQRTARIIAAGPMQFFKSAQTRLALKENKSADKVIKDLLREVVIPQKMAHTLVLNRTGSAEVDSVYLPSNIPFTVEIGVSVFAMIGDNWLQQGGYAYETQGSYDIYRAIWDVAAAERGRFFFNRDGRAIFWNRHHMIIDMDSAVDATFSDSMQNAEYTYADLNEFKNEITVTCHPRSVSNDSEQVLWQLDSEIQVDTKSSRTLVARYQDASGNRIGGKDVGIQDLTLSKGKVTVSVTPSANSAEIVLGNINGESEAIVTGLTLVGTKITDFGQMEASAKDIPSITDYGQRTLRLNLPTVDKYDDALGIAQFELSRRSQPQGMLTRIDLVSHAEDGGNNHTHQRLRTIGDRISVTESQTGHTSEYFIVGEAQELSQSGARFTTTWYLEPAVKLPLPWKLDATGRSELPPSSGPGGATILTY